MAWLLKYLAATYTYGILRTIPQFHGKKKEYLNLDTNKRELKPMPTVEKLRNACFRTCVAPGLWPFFLYNDATNLEFYLKGVSPQVYGFDDDFF